MKKAEKFIEEHTKKCSNRIDFDGDYDLIHHPWLFPNEARKAVEIAREEIYEWLEEHKDMSDYTWHEDELEFEPSPKMVSLDKVCEWIKNNAHKYIYFDEGNTEWYDHDECINDLRKAMKDE